jgi:hypothetical protein
LSKEPDRLHFLTNKDPIIACKRLMIKGLQDIQWLRIWGYLMADQMQMNIAVHRKLGTADRQDPRALGKKAF